MTKGLSMTNETRPYKRATGAADLIGKCYMFSRMGGFGRLKLL